MPIRWSRVITFRRFFPIWIAVAALVVSLALTEPSLAADQSRPSKQSLGAGHFGRIPLSFEANRGQADPSTLFLSRGQGYTLFLKQGEAVLALRTARKVENAAAPLPGSLDALRSAEFNTSLVRVQLIGANPRVVVRNEAEQITHTNYFIGNDPSKWRTGIPNFGRIRYAGIYPGVDLVYYGNQTQLEHDFVVAPGADSSRIRFAVDGASSMRIDSNTGDLILTIGEGAVRSELRLLKPATYQKSSGRRTPIVSSYKLLSEGRIGFEVGNYNHAKPLVIDPILVYSTYLGGNDRGCCSPYDGQEEGDQGNGIAVDSHGEAYVVGNAYSTNFPVTAGAFQTRNNVPAGSTTVFVSKINSEGTALVYSTYVGGTGLGGPNAGDGGLGDFGNGIAIDSAGNAYITGQTFSGDFPVTKGAFQTRNGMHPLQLSTCFVTKLNAAGDRLVYSTFVGGSDATNLYFATGEAANAIAVDSRGDAFITGYAYSFNFPVTAGSVQPKFAGKHSNGIPTSNAFVAGLDPAGASLLLSTYLGGTGYESQGVATGGDQGNAIGFDPSGNVYVAGMAHSWDFPVTRSAFQTTNNAAPWEGPNGFVSKLNPTGTAFIYSSLLGGSGTQSCCGHAGESVSAIAVDSHGNAYVTGTAQSSDFPTTPGVLEPVGILADYPGSTGFVTKFVPDGSRVAFSTFLGSMNTAPAAIALDAWGNIYIGGTAATWTFPETPDAIVPNFLISNASQSSPFVAKLDPAATTVRYSTLIAGSEATDGGGSYGGISGLAVNNDGDVYVTGFTSAVDFPTSKGALQSLNRATDGIAMNAFVSRLWLGAQDVSHYPTQTVVEVSGYSVTATVTASGGGAPTGSVAFAANRCGSGYCYLAPMAVEPLNQSGVATWAPNLFESSFDFTAVYLGDAAHLTSAPINETTAHWDGLSHVDPPSLTPAPGSYTGPVVVKLSDDTPGASIYYTTDGSTPTIHSAVYTKPIKIASTTLIQAAAISSGNYISNVTGGSYELGTPGTTFNLADSFSTSTIHLNGSAQLTASSIQLTDNRTEQVGSAYFHRRVPITSFSTRFTFLLSNPTGGDGMTFVLQNVGPDALGGVGAGLGYGPNNANNASGPVGIHPSACVKFDLFNNRGEGHDSTGFYTQGASPTVPSVDMSHSGVDLHSGHPIQVELSYDGTDLVETVTDIVTHAFFKTVYKSVNLPEILGTKDALVGFTAATGIGVDETNIFSWSYSSSADEP